MRLLHHRKEMQDKEQDEEQANPHRAIRTRLLCPRTAMHLRLIRMGHLRQQPERHLPHRMRKERRHRTLPVVRRGREVIAD